MKGKLLVLKKLTAVMLAAVLVAGLGLSADFGTKSAKAEPLPVIFIKDNSVGTGTGSSASNPLQADEYSSSDTTDTGRVKATALYKAW
ncbi:MAG: hypothetical protein IK088_08060, partial [Lachnospiraceae bacterium]|nr:hypothetical protein [Lachnospiraceae bacterium]